MVQARISDPGAARATLAEAEALAPPDDPEIARALAEARAAPCREPS